MLPRPTAEPIAAIINTERLENVSRAAGVLLSVFAAVTLVTIAVRAIMQVASRVKSLKPYTLNCWSYRKSGVY